MKKKKMVMLMIEVVHPFSLHEAEVADKEVEKEEEAVEEECEEGKDDKEKENELRVRNWHTTAGYS